MSPPQDDDLPPLPTLPLGRYRHYKGGEYEVVGVARHSEDLSPLVVYRPLYNRSGWWVRPYAMFRESGMFEGRAQPRFTLIEPSATAPATSADLTALTLALQTLEAELHHPGVRCTPARLESLLHPDFHEVGRSGRPYTRETVMDFLAREGGAADIVAWAYAAQPLGPDVALLTYQSAHRGAEGALTSASHRASIWRHTAQGWQLFYHQGTPAAEAN